MRHVIIGPPVGGFRLAGRDWALGATSRTAKGTLVGGISRALAGASHISARYAFGHDCGNLLETNTSKN